MSRWMVIVMSGNDWWKRRSSELNFCSGEDYFGPFMFFVRILYLVDSLLLLLILILSEEKREWMIKNITFEIHLSVSSGRRVCCVNGVNTTYSCCTLWIILRIVLRYMSIWLGGENQGYLYKYRTYWVLHFVWGKDDICRTKNNVTFRRINECL